MTTLAGVGGLEAALDHASANGGGVTMESGPIRHADPLPDGWSPQDIISMARDFAVA